MSKVSFMRLTSQFFPPAHLKNGCRSLIYDDFADIKIVSFVRFFYFSFAKKSIAKFTIKADTATLRLDFMSLRESFTFDARKSAAI